jgi:hypothetical protein
MAELGVNLAIIADHRQAGHYRRSPSLASPLDRGRSPPVAPSAATRQKIDRYAYAFLTFPARQARTLEAKSLISHT